tara:strand:- start:4516 stop:9360 length:4845 start_codon:yes stop_codon:yes gene_type:complete
MHINNPKFKLLPFILAFFFLCIGYAQQISINDTFSAQELIEDHLIDGCVEISNVQSVVNGRVNSINSFGYFERSNSSFPFENGILLSTGSAISAGNTLNANPLSEGEVDWTTDTDLEDALGITNTLNATSIEFDFISVSNQVQFNYILASEEYYANYPCEYSDGFAFLIKEAGTSDPYVNVALIPGTNVAVNTSNIHEEVVGFCPADNEQYFDGYNLGDTNFNGRTTVLTATANILPNIQYHIKLVIADQEDENFDSVVFLEANSFTSSIDLGPDVTTCAEYITLDGNTQNPLATYTWLENGSPISGETSSTLTVTNSGTYTVAVSIPINNTFCEFEDTVTLTLNSEQSADTIPDFEVCDDVSNDGIHSFDLTEKNQDVLNAVPNGNYDITYYLNAADASSGVSEITAPFTNTQNPQSIFVRILDTENGCLAFGSFNLIVNALPTITTPTPLEVCDDGNGDGFTLIDLTVKDTEITNGNTDYSVTYHYNQTDSETGANPVPTPYSNITQADLLFVSVVNTLTGCRTTTTLNVIVLESPEVLSQTQTIDACEQDGDGFESFDLTSIIDDVLNGLTDVTTSFHETYVDAQNGDNPIENVSNYINTTALFQIVYIRVVSNISGCPSIVNIELHANLLVNESNIRNFAACDDESNDGIEDFDLESIGNTIINGLENVTISFYESEADQIASSNAINTNLEYTVSNAPHILYITLESDACSVDSEIELNINPAIILPDLGSVTFCDTDDDSLTSVDLSSFNAYVGTGVPYPRVRYFLTEDDAVFNENPLPRFYNNPSRIFNVYVRVSSDLTGCFDVAPLEIEVLPAPSTTRANDIVICDSDQDGFSIVNLNAKISEIVTSTEGVIISFHRTFSEAETNANGITNTSAFNANTQTIYTRVERISTGCFAIENFEIIVNTLPVFNTISNFINCETDGNQITEFILQEKDADILNRQSGKRVLYFENAEDALNRTNIIDKTVAYENTSNPQEIHIRVENISDTDCFGVSSFFIEVGSIPIFNLPLDTFTCDDISNDGREFFDLSIIQNQVTQGITDNLTVTFYENLEDAENNENALDLNYQNQINPQQIYTRIDNGTYCYGIAEFGLNVIQVPNVNQSVPMAQCDSDYDGISTFDLTISEIDVLEVRQNNIVVTYYENIDDLEANINNIPNPETYNNVSNPQTVFIRVTNTISECFVTVPLELAVNLPPTINSINNYNTCDTLDNMFNLNETIDSLINGQPNVAVTFYASQTDAENAQNVINPNYNYNSTNDIIHVRAQNTNTGCFSVSHFTLVIDPAPIANTPANLEDCDDDYDSMLYFDLAQQTNTILGNQSPVNFLVSYFELEIEAIENENPITDLNYNAFDGQTIYVRVQNYTTGCFSTTSFMTYVHRKPIVEISDQTVCLDNLPLVVSAETGFSTDTYAWSTNANTPEIEITELGIYSVTVTTDYGCTTSVTFNVIESEQATIDFTETIDFSNPNNITVTISGIGNYMYIIDNGAPQTSNVFYNVTLGPHTIEVYDLNGCASAIKEIVIIDAPLFFTPNQDGQNDTWHITGVDQIPGTIVHIFDRYGKLLKTLNHTSYGWDGTYNGQNMPTSDYWFVAQVKKGNKQFEVRRHFTLKR